jgi:hypothetical protein
VKQEELRQMTIDQLRKYSPKTKVFVRLVVEGVNDVITRIRGYDALIIKKQERKRKGPLIKAIYPTSFLLDFREKYTIRSRSEIWSSEEGTFYCNCGPGSLWILQVFSEQGEGKTLLEAEQGYLIEATERREKQKREWDDIFGDIEVEEFRYSLKSRNIAIN